MQFFYLFFLFMQVAVPLVKRVLKALGIGAVVYVGFNLAMDQAFSYIQQQFANVPGPAQALMGIMQLDVFINIYFAALSTRAILRGLDKLSDRKKTYSVFEA